VNHPLAEGGDEPALLTAHRRDLLQTAPETTMDTTVRLDGAWIRGTTRLRTRRRLQGCVGAVRVLAADADGGIVGFTGERRFRVGGTANPIRRSARVMEWSTALFAADPTDIVRLEIVHFTPPRGGLADWFAAKRR
jgi:hypothetical protein